MQIKHLFLFVIVGAKKREKPSLKSTLACPPGHGPIDTCPYGYQLFESVCYRAVDSALQWDCIVGKYDPESHSCITQHKRHAELKCPAGYFLKGLLCESLAFRPYTFGHSTCCCDKLQCLLEGSAVAPHQSVPPLPPPRYPSFLATPDCLPDEDPDMLEGACVYKEHYAPRAACAGEILTVDGAMLCRVRVSTPPVAVCAFRPLQPDVDALDILAHPGMLKDYFRQQQPIYLTPGAD